MEDVALTRVVLAELMAKLNRRPRVFLELRLQGCSVWDIAEMMAITRHAACWLLVCIRKKAMPVLEEDGLGYKRRGRRPCKKPKG